TCSPSWSSAGFSCARIALIRDHRRSCSPRVEVVKRSAVAFRAKRERIRGTFGYRFRPKRRSTTPTARRLRGPLPRPQILPTGDLLSPAIEDPTDGELHVDPAALA